VVQEPEVLLKISTTSLKPPLNPFIPPAKMAKFDTDVAVMSQRARLSFAASGSHTPETEL
jgi:hypothetical protein